MSSPTSPAPARITLRDIARTLDISHVTVSLALRDHPRISADRRAQIKKTALAMGYRPDPMLTALSHYRHSRAAQPVQAVIAWLNLWPEPKQLRSFKEFDGYWRGASEVAEKHGYRLEEFCPSPRLPMSRIEQVLITRNTRGILLPPPPVSDALQLRSLKWDEFSIVRFGHSLSTLPVHLVTSDQPAACMLAFNRAREFGYKRVGFVAKDTSLINTLFAAGYLQAQLKVPVEQRLPMLSLTARQPEQHSAQLKTWLEQHKPDAIITQLAELRQLLGDVGLQVPRDIGLAALSVLDGNADAGIDQNPEEIGRVATETLISLINHNHRGIPRFQRQILVEGSWIDGSTLPRRPNAPSTAAEVAAPAPRATLVQVRDGKARTTPARVPRPSAALRR